MCFFGVRTLKVSKCFQTPKMVTWHHALTADTLKCLYQLPWHLSPQKCKESLEARSDRLSKKFETKHCNRWNIREPSLQPIPVEGKPRSKVWSSEEEIWNQTMFALCRTGLGKYPLYRWRCMIIFSSDLHLSMKLFVWVHDALWWGKRCSYQLNWNRWRIKNLQSWFVFFFLLLYFMFWIV